MPDLDIAAVVRLPLPATVDIDVTPRLTKHGPLDMVFTPDGAPQGYEDLKAGSEERPVQAPDARALVISVAVWEQLKLAAGRAKDLEHLDRFYER